MQKTGYNTGGTKTNPDNILRCVAKENRSYGYEGIKMKRFLYNEGGLETVEYAIILGLIVVGTITLVITLGGWVRDQFQSVVDNLP